MSKTVKIILIVVVALIVACGGFAWYLIANMNKQLTAGSVQTVAAPEGYNDPAAEEEEVLDAEPTPDPGPAEIVAIEAATTAMPIYETDQKDEEIFNILLVGTDSRDAPGESEGRSDTMILASYNKATNKITLVSFMRDMQVTRIGEKSKFKGKLNAAYSNGGVGELINTLNLDQNFGLDIQNYMSVGFAGFWVMIDGIGGVDIPNLTAEEAMFINWRCAGLLKADDKSKRFEILKKMGKPALEEVDGPATLMGEQAVWYCRDRYSSYAGDEISEETKAEGGDFGRVDRQQYLIKQVYRQMTEEFTLLTLIDMYQYASNWCTTNMTMDKLISIATSIYNNKPEIVNVRVPFEGTYSYELDEEGNKTSTIVVKNMKETKARLHEILYGTAPTPTPEVAD